MLTGDRQLVDIGYKDNARKVLSHCYRGRREKKYRYSISI